MKFELNEYNRNLSEEDLIEDIRSVAEKLSKSYVSKKEYETNGKYSATPYIRRFGTWLNALENAALSTVRCVDDFKKISNDKIIDDLKNISQKLKQDSLTTSQYRDLGKYGIQTVLSRYTTWESALKNADLKPTSFKGKISDEAIFLEIERMWTLKGKPPSTTDVRNGNSIYSLNTYSRRFGGWRKTLERFIEYINQNEDDRNIGNGINQKINTKSESRIIKPSRIKKRITNREINLRLRFKVLQRDNFKCLACGKSPATDLGVVLHVDHLMPWSRGGETILENLQTLCSNCNLGKSDIIF